MFSAFKLKLLYNMNIIFYLEKYYSIYSIHTLAKQCFDELGSLPLFSYLLFKLFYLRQ